MRAEAVCSDSKLTGLPDPLAAIWELEVPGDEDGMVERSAAEVAIGMEDSSDGSKVEWERVG